MKKFYLFVVTTLSAFIGAFAQLTPPDSIVVELTGPSTSAYIMPAKMVIKTFGPATSTFTGSNNKPETGSPFYSQSVDAGATFFQITGQPAGFPPRKSTSSPQPNRTGGSSFLAIKDSAGFKKYWMNISVGGYLNNGTQIYQWEYHFRYFYNSKTGEETATLGSVPNSGEYVPGPVDFLVSLGNQKCKPFAGVIKDSYANLITGNLAQDPLPNAQITLKEGSAVIKTLTTNSNGEYSFSTDSLSKDKLYNLEINFQSDTVPLKVLLDNIKVCNASPSIVVPNREMKAVLAELKGLTGLHIDASVFGGTVADAIPIKDYNLASIKQEIGKWKEIDKEYEKTIETMNRTYLSLYLLKDYYGKSNVFSGKLLRLFYEVGSGVVSMINSANTVQKLVGDEVLKIDKKLLAGASGPELLQLKKDLIVLKVIEDLIKKVVKSILDGYQKGLIDAALASFGDSDEDKIAKACIHSLSKVLEQALYGGGNLVEDLMKEIAFNIGTKLVVDQYYIGSTQAFVDKISPKITAQAVDGSWANAANTVRPLIAASEQANTEAVDAGEAFESAAGQFGTVGGFIENASKVAAVTVIGAPLAPPLYTISKFVKGFSLASNSLALALYAKRYFSHTSELEAGLAKTFNPFGGNMLREDYPSTVSARMNADPVSAKAFEDSLLKYRNNIDNYTIVREAALVDHIDSLGSLLDKDINDRLNQASAALSGNQADAELAKIYKELTAQYSEYNSRYLAVQLQTIAHLLDSNNVDISSSLKLEIDTLVLTTKPLVKVLAKVDSILPLVTNPYQFVRISEVIAPDTIWHDSNFEVTVKYKNYGNFRALGFGIKLEPSADLMIANDSLGVPLLAAGAEASIKVQVSAGDLKPNPSIYVTFQSVTGAPETILLPFYATIIKRGDVVNSIESEIVANTVAIRVFPNPATEELYVVSSTSLGQGRVNLYDTKGTLQLSQMTSGTNTQLSTGSLSSGLYILTVQDASGQIVKREKVVIANSK